MAGGDAGPPRDPPPRGRRPRVPARPFRTALRGAPPRLRALLPRLGPGGDAALRGAPDPHDDRLAPAAGPRADAQERFPRRAGGPRALPRRTGRHGGARGAAPSGPAARRGRDVVPRRPALRQRLPPRRGDQRPRGRATRHAPLRRRRLGHPGPHRHQRRRRPQRALEAETAGGRSRPRLLRARVRARRRAPDRGLPSGGLPRGESGTGAPEPDRPGPRGSRDPRLRRAAHRALRRHPARKRADRRPRAPPGGRAPSRRALQLPRARRGGHPDDRALPGARLPLRAGRAGCALQREPRAGRGGRAGHRALRGAHRPGLRRGRRAHLRAAHPRALGLLNRATSTGPRRSRRASRR